MLYTVYFLGTFHYVGPSRFAARCNAMLEVGSFRIRSPFVSIWMVLVVFEDCLQSIEILLQCHKRKHVLYVHAYSSLNVYVCT